MNERTEELFTRFVAKIRDSGEANLFAFGNDERGGGVVVYDCRCGSLKCVGLTLAVLDGDGNAAMFGLTPTVATVIGAALLKVGAS